MKKLLFILLLFIITVFGYGQKDTVQLKQNKIEATATSRSPQAVYIQLAGSGPYLSVNYDRRFNKKVNGLGFSAGLGYFEIIGVKVFSVPVSINYLLGKRDHFLEAGGGATFVSASVHNLFNDQTSSGSGFFYHLNAGYRYQPSKRRFFFRGGFSPLFAQGYSVMSGYIAIGYSF